MAKVTIYDVAKKADCSTATVSLVLANSTRIQPKTRKRVLDAVSSLGYTPNYMAQSLSKKSTNTLGLIVPNMENPLFSMMISGIEDYANSKGYDLILGLSDSNCAKESFYLDMLQRKRVDGLIVFPTFLDSLISKLSEQDSSKPPVVLCGSSGNGIQNVSYVKCDNHVGAFIAVNHLINTGRKRIGCIFPVFNEQQCRTRKTGYQDALAHHNIEYDESLIKICSADNDSIFAATRELISEKHPDAVFCLYDYCAISVMRAIYSAGLRIPQDISVIGYDNIQISGYLPTSLSTIDTHGKNVGQRAAEILIQKIFDPDTPIRQVTVKPELVVRESTAI